jgi:hypothetical protein
MKLKSFCEVKEMATILKKAAHRMGKKSFPAILFHKGSITRI